MVLDIAVYIIFLILMCMELFIKTSTKMQQMVKFTLAVCWVILAVISMYIHTTSTTNTYMHMEEPEISTRTVI